MKNIGLVFSILAVNFLIAGNEKKYTQKEYLELWKDVAIQQMNEYKIPASITLAQGIIESGYGNSDLARNANNHFGIKCHNWKGETFYKDAETESECYRKYSEAKQSYIDHSVFLSSKSRYASLFELEITDYKSWARGLKDAGYATNPNYPQLLIELIEKMNLNELDQSNLIIHHKNSDKVNKETFEKLEKQVVKTLMTNTHQIQIHKNKIKYIIAKKGDTYYRISKEFNVALWELRKYNEFEDKKDYLVEGDMIYLEPKKRKSKTTTYYNVKEDISLRMIAHKEGIKVKRLMKINDLASENEIIQKGNKIKLR